jgi:hypothetical protein
MKQLEIITQKIHKIRNQKVMLDYDLAALYEIETRVLKQSVKRNASRFPSDFMFALTENEINDLVSQSVIPSKSYFGGSLPFAFTEQGVAMLSSVLKNDKAIEINISIMRTFVTIRQFALNYTELQNKINEIEGQLPEIYNVLNYLVEKDATKNETKRTKIGFKK